MKHSTHKIYVNYLSSVIIEWFCCEMQMTWLYRDPIEMSCSISYFCVYDSFTHKKSYTNFNIHYFDYIKHVLYGVIKYVFGIQLIQ